MTALEKAKLAWGELPNWLFELCKECDLTSLRKTAARLQVSPASLTLVINKQRITTDFVEKKVKESLEKNVICPFLGEITALQCKEEREKPFLSTNPIRIEQYKTCKSCKNKELLCIQKK